MSEPYAEGDFDDKKVLFDDKKALRWFNEDMADVRKANKEGFTFSELPHFVVLVLNVFNTMIKVSLPRELTPEEDDISEEDDKSEELYNKINGLTKQINNECNSLVYTLGEVPKTFTSEDVADWNSAQRTEVCKGLEKAVGLCKTITKLHDRLLRLVDVFSRFDKDMDDVSNLEENIFHFVKKTWKDTVQLCEVVCLKAEQATTAVNPEQGITAVKAEQVITAEEAAGDTWGPEPQVPSAVNLDSWDPVTTTKSKKRRSEVCVRCGCSVRVSPNFKGKACRCWSCRTIGKETLGDTWG